MYSKPQSLHVIGLDLGQTHDYTALVVLERAVRPEWKLPWADDPPEPGPAMSLMERWRREPTAPRPALRSPALKTQYDIRHIERFDLGTGYPTIVTRLVALMDKPELAGHVRLVVDETGVGKPVVDMLRQAKLRPIPVTITAGTRDAHVEHGIWRVSKRELVSVVKVLLQSRTLKIAPMLPEAGVLVKELENFQMKITDAMNDTYGAWREGEHDDLVLATALACWWAKRQALMPADGQVPRVMVSVG